jgi:hypothetical protein
MAPAVVMYRLSITFFLSEFIHRALDSAPFSVFLYFALD